jgi:protein SCO1/2
VATERNRGRLQKGFNAMRPLGVAVVLSATLLFIGCGSDESPDGAASADEMAGMTRNPPLKVGSASLPNVNPDRKNRGDHFRANRDSLMLAFFGFTFCPDVCPTTLADVRLALAELKPSERDRVEVAMVTVDPERDTAKALNQYVGHFFPEESFAAFRTDNPDRLARVEEQFGAAHELGKPKADGSYDVSHTAQVYAIDDQGVVRVEWPFGSGFEAIAADTERLLGEQSGRPAPGNDN